MSKELRVKERLELLTTYDINLLPSFEEFKSYNQFRLPVPKGADYQLLVHIWSDGEPQIVAKLIGESESQFFWYQPFHIDESDPSIGNAFPDEQFNEFKVILTKLLTCPSRIRQKKGWLMWQFTGYYFDKNEWSSLETVSKWRGFGKIPKIQGNKKYYDSPPIIDKIMNS